MFATDSQYGLCEHCDSFLVGSEGICYHAARSMCSATHGLPRIRKISSLMEYAKIEVIQGAKLDIGKLHQQLDEWGP